MSISLISWSIANPVHFISWQRKWWKGFLGHQWEFTFIQKRKENIIIMVCIVIVFQSFMTRVLAFLIRQKKAIFRKKEMSQPQKLVLKHLKKRWIKHDIFHTYLCYTLTKKVERIRRRPSHRVAALRFVTTDYTLRNITIVLQQVLYFASIGILLVKSIFLSDQSVQSFMICVLQKNGVDFHGLLWECIDHVDVSRLVHCKFAFLSHCLKLWIYRYLIRVCLNNHC